VTGFQPMTCCLRMIRCQNLKRQPLTCAQVKLLQNREEIQERFSLFTVDHIRMRILFHARFAILECLIAARFRRRPKDLADLGL
jgi:hypothetical protein